MKVVIDARESGTSTGRYIDKLVEHIHKLNPGHNFIVLAKPHRLDYLSAVAPNFKIVASPINEFGWAEQTKLLRQIVKLQPDLVHFGMTQQPVLYRGRTVTTVHDLITVRFRNPAKNRFIFFFKQQVYKGVVVLAAHKSIRLITPTSFVRQDLADFAKVALDKITVTHEAADKISEPAKPVESLARNGFILYVGRPQPYKNLERLVGAFSVLRKDFPELKLVLAGKKDSLYKRLEAKTKTEDVDGVVFTDFVGEGQLRWLYENCSAYVFPSLSEGFGLPGLEAMVHGAPVISSDASCLPEVYGPAAYYFNPLDTNDMAGKIKLVLSDSKLRQELIEKGRKQSAKYSWEKTARQTLEVYEQAFKS